MTREIMSGVGIGVWRTQEGVEVGKSWVNLNLYSYITESNSVDLVLNGGRYKVVLVH